MQLILFRTIAIFELILNNKSKANKATICPTTFFWDKDDDKRHTVSDKAHKSARAIYAGTLPINRNAIKNKIP